MSDYEKLRNAVEMKCEIHDFKEVNKCIKGILSDENRDDEINIIKSLISHFEGKLNNANLYTISTISYALIIGSFSILAITLNKDREQYLIIFLVFYVIAIAIYVAFHSMRIRKSDYKDAFILKALNFKLDELIDESKHIEPESVSGKKEKTESKKKSKKSSHRK